MQLLLGLPSAAEAATLQGTVAPAAATPRRGGFWRIENGRLPIAPDPAGSYAGSYKEGPAVVILVPEAEAEATSPTGTTGTTAHERVTVEVHRFTIEPRLLVVSRGALLEIHNATKAPRALELVGTAGAAGTETAALSVDRPLSPGEKREVSLSQVGEVHVRDPGTPRAAVTVVVVETPFRALTNDQGEFHIDAPAGKYLLKAYGEGAWTAGEPVEVGRQAAPLRVTLPVARGTAGTGGNPGQNVRAEGATPEPPPRTSAASAGSPGK